MGALFLYNLVVLLLFTSLIYRIKPKNNCYPQSNVVLEKMPETNHSPEISRVLHAQNSKIFLTLPTSETGCTF